MNEKRLFKILKTIIDNEKRLLFVITDKKVELVNKAFLEFYQVKNLAEFIQKYEVPCHTMKIDGEFITKSCKDDGFYEYMKELEENEIQINDSFF